MQTLVIAENNCAVIERHSPPHFPSMDLGRQ